MPSEKRASEDCKTRVCAVKSGRDEISPLGSSPASAELDLAWLSDNRRTSEATAGVRRVPDCLGEMQAEGSVLGRPCASLGAEGGRRAEGCCVRRRGRRRRH